MIQWFLIQELKMNLEQIEKGDHFMKEIYEQPSVIKDTYRGRLHANEDLFKCQVWRII
jgi:glucosamine--fructose-6-phosphate aminotransferase (isomerizing)